jgi:hypothetical protein
MGIQQSQQIIFPIQNGRGDLWVKPIRLALLPAKLSDWMDPNFEFNSTPLERAYKSKNRLSGFFIS